MLILNVWASLGSILIAVAVGLYVHYSKHHALSDIKVPPWEYSFITLLLILAINPLICWVGYNQALTHQTEFKEFLTGVELQPTYVTYQCHESSSEGGSTGGCIHYYDTDSYQVWVSSESCSGTGKDRRCRDTSHWVTKYRQCPYTDTETDWIIPSTVGETEVGSHWLPANPASHRLSPEHDWPEALSGGLDAGTPQLWAEAFNRVTSGKPGPVTVEHTYLNYLLASQNTILKQYSGALAQFQKLGVLPDINHNVYDFYFLDSVYFAGFKPSNVDEWQSALAKLNAVIGSNAQGRLYVVVVNANTVPEGESTNYLMALTAYWESQKFNKYDISKNGIIVVLGTKDGSHIDWSTASTAMPKGNEAMLWDFRHDLSGTALTPATVLGNLTLVATPNQKGYQVSALGSEGVVGKIIMDGPDKFQRVPMHLYLYLRGDIKLTGGETTIILLIDFLLSVGIWAGIAIWGMPAFLEWRARQQ